MGGDRIIVHTGSCGKLERGEALTLALDTMRMSLEALDREGSVMSISVRRPWER